MSARNVGSRLRVFREAAGLSVREAARQLQVRHPTVRAWESGLAIPVPEFREAIEVWTGGKIKADEWPRSKRNRAIAGHAAAVRAVQPAAKSA